MSYDGVRERLAALGVGGGEAFWQAIRTNLTKVADAAAWWPVVHGPLTPVITDAALVGAAAEALPGRTVGRLDLENLDGRRQRQDRRQGAGAVHALAARFDRRRPRAGTGRSLPLIGRDRTSRRLRGETA